MKRTFVAVLLAAGTWLVFAPEAGSCPQQPGPAAQTKEPLSASSKNWLEEVVPYIITSKEKAVFLALPTELDRGRFIETFWRRRDPDPQTPENEFKVEYFKRVAAANKLFGTGGLAGWRTDRGKIYILLGPPKDIQRDMNPRPASNSLVSVFAGAKETWQYWDLPNPNLPYNMEFVFSDKFGTGNYMLENSSRVDLGRNRPIDASQISYQFDYQELLAEAQKNPFDGLDRLKEVITTQVNYAQIPFSADVFFFKGSETKTFVPLALEVRPSSLTSKRVDDKKFFSVGLVLNVSDPLGRLVFERSKDLNFQTTGPDPVLWREKPFLVEAALDLEPGTYKLHVLVLDNFSGKVGTSHEDLVVPSFGTEGLAVSDVLLSAQGSAVPEGAGPVPVGPGGTGGGRRVFQAGDELEVYFEIYNLALDPRTGRNQYAVNYSFVQGGRPLTAVTPSPAGPTPDKDCRIRTSFRLKNFKPGEYVLKIEVTDALSGRSRSRDAEFVIVE